MNILIDFHVTHPRKSSMGMFFKTFVKVILMLSKVSKSLSLCNKELSIGATSRQYGRWRDLSQPHPSQVVCCLWQKRCSWMHRHDHLSRNCSRYLAFCFSPFSMSMQNFALTVCPGVTNSECTTLSNRKQAYPRFWIFSFLETTS